MNNRVIELEERLERQRRILLIPIRRLKDRTNPIEELDDIQFRQRFHMQKETVHFLYSLIRKDLESPINRGAKIPPMIQLLVACRYYATGTFQIVIGDLYTVAQASVSRIVERISTSIAKHSQTFIKYPTFQDAVQERREFYKLAGFPGVVGCIDCTHVGVISPGGSNAELFRNRKSTFSINVQAICNSNMEFTDVVARWWGSAHDSRIFESSIIQDKIEHNEVPGLLLGDSGYACSPYLMTPLLTPTTAAEKAFNKAQKTTRNIIERSFGVWKRRFPCLNLMRIKTKTVLTTIMALATIHNICRKRNDIIVDDGTETITSQGEPIFNPGETTSTGRAARSQLIASHFSR